MAAFRIPILPHTSPPAPQPPSIALALHPHQLRALHRCLLVENDGSLAKDFGAQHDYRSRGGCLADAVGMGKTATIIGLILSSPRERGEGDTLVVAPGHLVRQWKDEIAKFAGGMLEVVVGRRDYDRLATLPPEGGRRRVVLVDVDSVMSSEKLWYDWRCVYSVSHDELGRRHLSVVRDLSPQKMAEYKKAALFCVKSPKGPCSYTGYVYTSTLHMPFRPWRRVVYDEIQDLVSGGDDSGKNLLQLSRTAQNVWLVSATPFPHGNRSVYANHELLGFCRLRMELEKDARGDPIAELPRYHPFEVIKRKLYIRSPRHIADEAVTSSRKTTRSTVYVDATPLERKFFELERADIGSSPSIFGDEYASLRQMMIHPEACKKLREDADGGSKSVGRFATVNSFAKRSLATAKERLRELDRTLLPNAQRDIDLIKSSWHLALKIRQVRESAPVQANPFARREESSTPAGFCLETEEDNAIRAYCKTDEKTLFQTIGRGQDAPAVEISGHKAISRVIDYFRNEAKPGRKIPYNANGGEEHEYLEVFIRRKETFYHTCITKKNSLLVERSNLVTRIMALEETVKVGGNITRGMTEDEELVARNGSKTAALIHHLREIRCMGEKTIVFSYWHDVLSLVHRSLRTNGLDVAFCNGRTGNMMTKAIHEFTSGDASVLLLSAEVKASGANLQVATNVVLLDPAGDSAEHGANLETQAIGRAVRMGQENAVRVVRFCVRDTVEEELFRRIDVAAANSAIRNNDDAYVCESAHKSLNEKVLEKRMEDDDVDDEVFVGESVSVGERVARAKARAIEKNEIIVIDDSDDDDTKPPSNAAKSVGDITSKGNKMNADEAATANPRMKVKAAPSPRAFIRQGPCRIRTPNEGRIQAEPSAKFATAKRSNESVAAVTDNATSFDKRARVTPEMLPPVTDTSNASKREPFALAKEGNGGDNIHSAYRPPGVTSPLCVVDSPTVAASIAKSNQDFISGDAEWSKIVTDYCAMSNFNSYDRKFIDMMLKLREVEIETGLAWVPGQKCPLGKWCASQRREYVNGGNSAKSSEKAQLRIRMLNKIGFPWTKTAEATPKKQGATMRGRDPSRVVTPTSGASMEGAALVTSLQMKH